MRAARGVLLVCATALVFLVPASPASAVVIQITLADFDNPVVLDFEGLPAGPIAGADPIFTDAGIASASVAGGNGANDTLNANVSGNALGSVNGNLSVVPPGGAFDFGVALGDPVYTFDLVGQHSRFGALIVDQFNHNIVFDFNNGGGLVGTFNFTTPNSGPLSDFRIYMENSNSFDQVVVRTNGGNESTGGYALDDVTLEQVPEPTTVTLLALGLGGLGLTRRRHQRKH